MVTGNTHIQLFYLVCSPLDIVFVMLEVEVHQKKNEPCVQHCRGVLDVDSNIKSRFRDHDRAHGICAWAIDRTSRCAWCAPSEASNAWRGLHYTHRQEESRRLCRQCLHHYAS